MSDFGDSPAAFMLLHPPYETLDPVPRSQVATLPIRGRALVWDLKDGIRPEDLAAASDRPRGLALMVMLPPAERLPSNLPVFEIIESCRPHSILPHHPVHEVDEWSSLLRRLPPDLPAEVIDHLIWSGVRIDRDTRHVVRRILELSAELRTVSALARALYVSRRALGRRLLQRGLPVPSHWLHFGRILRAALKLQASSDNLFTVACSLGYPDGFALSNQMKRLTGVRPSDARAAFGWEWLVEAWMGRERAGVIRAEERGQSRGKRTGAQRDESQRDIDRTRSSSPT